MGTAGVKDTRGTSPIESGGLCCKRECRSGIGSELACPTRTGSGY